MSNFPTFDFKIDCGDDPKVRQWLHDNGVRWSSGHNLTLFMPETLLLLITSLMVEHCKDDVEFYKAHCLPQINPYDYMQEVGSSKTEQAAPEGATHINKRGQFFKKGKTGNALVWLGSSWGFFGHMNCRLDKDKDWVTPIEPTVAERMAALVEKHKDKMPDWAKWVAVDMDGLYAYEHEPKITGGNVFGPSSDNVAPLAEPDTLDNFLLEHWQETLTELATVKRELIVELEPEGDCPVCNAKSSLEPEIVNCSCHTCAPCSACVDAPAKCSACGEVFDDWEYEAPTPACNMAEIAARDKRERSPAEYDYAVKLDAQRWSDICNKPKPLTIPSICLQDAGFQMLLGGDHGGRSGE